MHIQNQHYYKRHLTQRATKKNFLAGILFKYSMFFFKCKIQVRGNTYTGIFKYVTRTLKKQEVQ